MSIVLLVVTTACTIASMEVARATLQVIKISLGTGKIDGFLTVLPSNNVQDLLIWCTLLAVALPTFTWIGIYFRDDAFERVALRVIRSVREQLFGRVLRLPYLRLVEADPGVLVKRLMEDAGQVRTLVIEAGLRRIADIVLVVGIMIYLFILSPLFAGVSAIAVAVFFGVAYWSAGLVKGRMRARDLSNEKLVGAATEAFHRLIDIRCASKEDWELRRFSLNAAENESVTAYCVRWLLLDRSFTGYFQALGPMAVLLAGGWAVLANSISFETLVVVIAATSILYGPVNSLSAVPITLRQIEVSAENLLTLFEERIEREDKAWSQPGSIISTPAPLISIRNLNYKYGEGKQHLIVSALEIASGARVAVIGASGTGKSTLMRLMFGLLSDYEGEICLEGAEIRSLILPTLRQRIGYMPQEDKLFGGSIRANIAYGANDPNLAQDHEIWAVLSLAGIAGDVSLMPEGLDTRLELIGNNLSTGQRRRLSLARALMRRPDILLLDEPLSGVSPSERQAISRALLSLSGLALVIVSHDHEVLKGVDMAIRLRRLDYPNDAVVADVIHRQKNSAEPLVFDEEYAPTPPI